MYCLYTIEIFSAYCRISNKHGKNTDEFFSILMVLAVIKEIKDKFMPDFKIKLLDQVRQVLRYHHYSLSTEKTYCE